MPFPGGDADKVGNRYEALWTVYCLLQILSEEAESIHIEQVGKAWDAVEFTLQKSAVTQFHQVKRQNGNKGHWPVAALNSNQILSNAYRLQRTHPSSEFVFVSTDKVAQLHELAERALSLKDFALFQQEGLKAQEHKLAFDKVCEYLQINEPSECYGFLKLFKAKVIDETSLKELVRAKAVGLIAGDADSAISLLRSYSENNLQTVITANLLWKDLGFSPVEWSKDSNVASSFWKNNKRYATTDNAYLINKYEILRNDTNEEICAAVRGDKKFIAVVGDAGSGKSIAMQQSFRCLSDCKDTVFGFRIDRLDPKKLPEEVGQSLALPESPVHVLAHFSGDSPCILFIDQLDAVSLTSGRNPDFFDCIQEIFNQAYQYPNMKLVIGCRKFDLDNDHRFRRFFTKENSTLVTVGTLSESEVKHELKIAKIPVEKLNGKQRLLLQQPLLLGVFIQVASDEDAFDFTHEGDLFRLKVKQAKGDLRERFPERKVLWTQVMEMLSEYMSQHQTLSVPERVVDEHDDDAGIMASSGVLLYENRRYSFFHESFFDYVFANSFLGSGKSACDLLLSSEQHLFRRGQVRQILALQRSENFETYLENVDEILRQERIRLHIKVSLLEWIGTLSSPTSEELRLLNALADDEEHSKLKHIIWNCISGQSAWFILLDQENYISRWLTHENAQWVDHGIWFLRTIQREQADRVADILLPLYLSDKEAWRHRLLFVMQWADLGASRTFFDFFLSLLADGMLDEAKGPIAVNSTFFDLAYSLADERPEWVGELLKTYIERQLVLHPVDPEKLYSLNESSSETVNRLIDKAVERSPKAFVDSMFPLILKLTELTQQLEDSPDCIPDMFWGMYLDKSFSYHMHTYIIKGMQTAVGNLAKSDLVSFQHFFNSWKDSPYLTIQHLIVAGLTQADKHLSNEAIEYLVENYCRLKMGAGHGWLSRQLIEAATLHCSETKLSLLEDKLLSFYGNPVRRKTWLGKTIINSYFGYDQFTLLTGIKKPRQSHAVSMRIKEWQRKFLCELPAAPRSGTRGGVVHSPIAANGIKYMNDEQWLQAITKYDSDEHDHREFLKGGAFQLAGALQSRTAEDPERFAKLLLILPENTNRTYHENIIMGLCPINNRKVERIDLALFERCVLRVFNMPDKPCGRWLPRLIAHYKGLVLSDDILKVVLWFAQNSSEPDDESSGISTTQGFVEDLATKSMNSVRGVAIESIAELIFGDERYYRFFKPFLSLLSQAEANLAVRSEMAYFIIATAKYDKNYAFELFGLLIEEQPEEFLAARKVDEYIHYAIFDDLDRILPIIQRKIDSVHDFIQQAGARHACVTGLVSEDHDDLIQQCLHGSLSHRKGAAEVFSTNIISNDYGQQCREFILTLFEDDSAEVRREASSCLYKFKNKDLLPYRSFISSFITSRALKENSSMITSLLESSMDKLPDTVLKLIKAFLDSEGRDSGDVRTAASGNSYQISKLLIRLYSQTKSSDVKSDCLDAIDRMISFGSSGLGSELSQFDR